MRPELLQEDIAWNLEDNIRDKKYGKGCVVLIPFQMQIFYHTEYGSIGNIRAIKEGKQVHDAENGNQAQVDLRDEFSLGSAARYDSAFGVIGSTMGQIWVIEVSTTDALGFVVVLASILLKIFFCGVCQYRIDFVRWARRDVLWTEKRILKKALLLRRGPRLGNEDELVSKGELLE